MKKLSPRWTRILKMFHVLCLSIWIGGGAALLLLGFVRPETTAEADGRGGERRRRMPR